jgi:glycosyltransferase involved in cell wall biosynthesis
MIDFLLVAPAYRESRRLPVFLEALAAGLEAEAFQARVLVVDDGSEAAEQAAVCSLVAGMSGRHPIFLPPLLLPVNQGKGGAIMAGWCSGIPARWLAFADSDGATSAREIARVFRTLIEDPRGRDALFASRVKLLGRTVERKTARHLAGRVYATLVGALIHPGIYDSQCGFKIVSAAAFETVRGMLREKRFAFDVELLAALMDCGMSVEEVPVDWKDIPGSKVSFIRDAIRMFVSILRIRARRKHWRPAPGPAAPLAAAPSEHRSALL